MPSAKVTRIRRAFFDRPTLEVCRDCLGKRIVYESTEGRLSSRIVEVEAYIGENDPACHAAPGKTNRNRHLWGKPGIAYIYKIYGYYFCLNFVTEMEGFPAAVLLRAAEPVEGIGIMRDRTPTKLADTQLLSGPGRFCRAYGLDVNQDGWDLAAPGALLYLEDRHEPAPEIAATPRIGITKAADWPWRFYVPHSPSISGSAAMRGKSVSKGRRSRISKHT